MHRNVLSLVSTLLIYLIIFTKNTPVKSDVVVSLNLWNYTNPCGCLANRQCCGSRLLTTCTQQCYVRTKVCLDYISASTNNSDYNACPLGSTTINPLEERNTFNYALNQINVPFLPTFKWNFEGPPRFRVKIYTDDLRDSSAEIDSNRIIDYYIRDFNIDSRYIPAIGQDPVEWLEYPMEVGLVPRTDTTLRTFISFQVGVKCTNNYYTASCSVRCVPQDSCEGHYTCNQLTGAKICNNGFIDPSTSCTKKDPAVNLCDTENYCKNGGTCSPAFFAQINRTIPICCCPSGFGGQTCDDILSCMNKPCQNNGLCSIDATTEIGSCQCQLGFTGKYCETAIQCPANYYGDDCSIYCEAVNNCEIHTKCDYFGQLSCIDGWGNFPFCNRRLINPNIDPECPPVAQSCLNGGSCWNKQCCCPQGFGGARCELAIDPCSTLPSPCQNNALCISNSTTFRCLCLPGYSGVFCQTPIDPCIDRTLCSGNGVCTANATFTGYSCTCNNGYTGSNCGTVIDFCRSTPCMNDGTCYGFINGYFCNCPIGFQGTNCENTINMCSTRPCEPHGSCISIPGDYLCLCNQGWTNPKNCNEDIDECLSVPNPCQNGTCVNLPGSFVCNCNVGFTGTYCEKFIDACASSPCGANSISCTNQINSFICVCRQGFTGVRCETNINECESNPCFNGTCRELANSAGYECVCQLGYEGSRCDRQTDLCAQRPCVTSQFERCLPYLNNYICVCKPGYFGKNCEIEINECDSSPCKSNSTCIDRVNSYQCICLPGFTGTDCSVNLDPCKNITSTPCGSNGVCYTRYDVVISYYCLCNPGYQGINCENIISQCAQFRPCLNNAVCVDSLNNFTCNCRPGYEGRFCEIDILECASNPCGNNGICLDGVNSYTCLCSPGFTGINCNQRINVCASNPCLNSGQCLVSPLDPTRFTCNCTATFTGAFCQTLINPCDQSPCVAGAGFCEATTINGVYTFQCRCVTGYEGLRCQTITNNCGSDPCKNNGLCENRVGSYRCICLPNYYGINCENFYLCSQSPCSTVGAYSCTDDLNKYTCNCNPGFTGNLCETNIDECQSRPCLNNGTCTDIVNGYICTCPRFFFGKQCENRFNFCNPNPCFGGSTCVSLSDTFQCQCPIEYTGVLCNQLKDACSILPCENGGNCVNLVTDYRCNCAPGYRGRNCSEDINECLSNPCQSNGTCIDIVNGYYCSCLPGYTGTNCNTVINNCAASNICLNGGTCVNRVNSYSCICPTGFTGSRCESSFNLCASSGFTCNNNGLCTNAPNGTLYCLCPNGYTGSLCETNINECNSNPCQNNAECIDLVASYFCNCATDYYGTNCQFKYDNCVSQPCRNGATCLDKVGSFECRCPVGFSGNICQSIINNCERNNCTYGSCVNQLNGYTCNCFSGFTGQFCESDINECLNSSPCLNDATCVNSPGSYYCLCPPGYSGLRCETLFNRCLPSPCVRGNCVNVNATFVCQCPSGFTGTFCELDIDECTTQPLTSCFNNATCINTLGSYQCICLNGYTGSKCELSIDYCIQSPCINGGLCVNVPGSYVCNCLPGFIGNLCQINVNECASQPCRNGGTCTEPANTPNFYSCACVNGFTGVNCELLINSCRASPCANNSTCLDTSTFSNPNSYICYCPPGFTGRNCATRISICDLRQQCLNGGICVETSPTTFTCTCPSGFTGSACEIRMDACFVNNCVNGATCIPQDSTNYICICLNQFTGTFCERNRTVCAPNPCLNSGACFETSPGVFGCNCPAGTFGASCENIVQICNSQPCLNGQCVQNGINSYRCNCFPGYTGLNCETDIDECATQPCRNNATCVTPFVNMYQCICPNGFEGTNCERTIDLCRNNPCYYNSTCVQTSPTSFNCICTPGYTGDRCLIEINECASAPCTNGANCIDRLNGYTCQCLTGTTGVNCEIIIDQCNTRPCLNGGTCRTFINFYQCTCPQGYTGRNCESNIDYCALLAPCRNNATCTNQPFTNSYRCDCGVGYTGQFCEAILDVCNSSPCANGGTCRLTGINSFVCQCAANWGGNFCQQSIESCSGIVCLNGGTCLNTINSFQCVCPSNWQGSRCETPLDLCSPNRCVNGNCTAVTTPTLSYRCTCFTGWTGFNCDQDINECLIPNICNANSFCVNSPGSYTCNCLQGFTGPNCTSTILNCNANACSNGGTCSERPNGFTCSCPCGFAGARCEFQINDCTPNPCQNGGVCTEPTSCGYVCLCTPPYKGTNCTDVETVTTTRAGNQQFIINYPQEIVDFGTVENINFFSYLPCIYQAWNAANPPTCPQGFTNVRSSVIGEAGSCYGIFTNAASQSAASQTCANLNSRLVSISSASEYAVLRAWLATQNIASDLWTSGAYRNNDWFWDDNTSVLAALRNLSNFQRNSGEDALVLRAPRTFELASALSSTAGRGFICERAPTLLPLQTLLIGYKSARPGYFFPSGQNARRIVKIFFDVNITRINADSYGVVKPPSAVDYNVYCQSIQNPIEFYDNYWTIDVCGDYVNSQQDLNTITTALSQLWYRKITDFSNCNCLNVDIQYKTKYLGPNGEDVTRLAYTVYATTYNKIFEKGVANVQEPTSTELTSVLQNRYRLCVGNVVESSLFNVLLCGIVKKSEYNAVGSQITSSWRILFNSNTEIIVTIQGQQEYVSRTDGEVVTMVKYLLYVDNVFIDQSKQTQYDYNIVLNSLASKRRLCQNSFPHSYQFRIITKEKLCNTRRSNVENVLQSYYITNNPTVNAARVSIVIPNLAIEEYIDESGSSYYSLPIYVVLDNAVLDPRSNAEIYQVFQNNINRVEYLRGKVFTPVDTATIQLYRVALAFNVFTNGFVPRNLISRMEDSIKEAFESTTDDARNTKVSILRQQKYLSLNSDMLNQVQSFIANQDGLYYDGRIENNDNFINYLVSKVSSLSSILRLSTGEALRVLNQVSSSQIVRKSDLFTFYLQNEWMALSPIDILSISSLADQAWKQFYNRETGLTPTITLLVYDYETYVDNNNVYLGINYMITNGNQVVSKECFDMSTFPIDNIVCPTCSVCGAPAYKFYQATSEATTDYYYVDMVGRVNWNETQTLQWLAMGIYRAWIDEYKEYQNSSLISMPTLAVPFGKNVGPLGIFVTRVYYGINLNSKLAVNGIDRSPKLESIESFLQQQNKDFRVYDLLNTPPIQSAWRGIAYVNKYPLGASDKSSLENVINMKQKDLLSRSDSTRVAIVIAEDYYDTINSNRVTRVRYHFFAPDLFIEPCALTDLYITQVNNTYTASTTTFGYFARMRDLDLKRAENVIDIDLLTQSLQTIWFDKNKDKTSLQSSAVKVSILDQQKFTSRNDGAITRVQYAVTIDDKDIDSTNYAVPKLDDLNNYIGRAANVCNCYPLQSYRLYFNGEKQDQRTIVNVIQAAWSAINQNINVTVYLDPNPVVFNNRGELSSKISRLNYTVLFNNTADPTSLFASKPSDQSLLNAFRQANITYCDLNCVPALVYDVYLLNNVSTDNYNTLRSRLVDAWHSHNKQLFNKNAASSSIVTIDPRYKTPQGDPLYRLYYSFGLSNAQTARAAVPFNSNIDVTDILDPTDAALKASIGNLASVYPRANGVQSNPDVNSAANRVEEVTELKWWMILIIVIAAILLILLIALAIFACVYLRTNSTKHTIERAPLRTHFKGVPLEVTSSKDDVINTARTNNFSNMSTVDRRYMGGGGGTISTIKSQTRSFKPDLDNDDEHMRAMKLNLPQQYEVTIN